jgi:hypothetical protein
MEIYGDTTNHPHSTKVWLGCLKLVVDFHKDTRHKGNIEGRDEFLLGIPGSLPDVLSTELSHASSALDLLEDERKVTGADFAEEVASVLFFPSVRPYLCPGLNLSG